MNTVITVGSAVTMLMATKGIYSLQWWLDRTDYQRHFEDDRPAQGTPVSHLPRRAGH